MLVCMSSDINFCTNAVNNLMFIKTNNYNFMDYYKYKLTFYFTNAKQN